MAFVRIELEENITLGRKSEIVMRERERVRERGVRTNGQTLEPAPL